MPGRVWTLRAALEWTRSFLAEKGDEHPRISAEWLLSAATGLSRVELYAYFDRPLTPEERAVLRESVRRRAAGEPLQYVTGEVAFRHLVLKVEPGVLIPRPETEVLAGEVSAAIARLESPRVVDLCTGSGCVALSVAQEHPGARVVAVDISPVAVRVARDNAARLRLDDQVSVAEGNLFSGVPDDLRGRVDAVVANPPYVPSAELTALPAEVAGFEPRLALDGGSDGLSVYRRILAEAGGWLGHGGLLAVELHERTVGTAAQEALQWYEEVRVVRDLAGRDRVVVAQRPRTVRTQAGEVSNGRRSMMGKQYRVDPENPSAEVINLAATVLRDGGIVVFPTETVYGLGALADSKFGPHEIFEVKARPTHMPIPLLVETEDALDTWGHDVPEYAHNLAQRFWPGAVTIVVKASERVPRDFRAPDGTIGLRSPDHEVVRELIQAAGGPIFATSANTHGNPPPGSFREIEPRIIDAADVALDGGQTQHQMASTVVLCTGDVPVVLREGAVPTEEIMTAGVGTA